MEPLEKKPVIEPVIEREKGIAPDGVITCHSCHNTRDCPHCEGTGRVVGDDGKWRKCDGCYGIGYCPYC